LGKERDAQMAFEIIPYDWIPQDERQKKLHKLTLQYTNILKCKSGGPVFYTNGIMIELGNEYIYVHPEETICEHCNRRNPLGLVPDFGYPYTEKQLSVIWESKDLNCQHCGSEIRRRKILWTSLLSN
jgi:hypothetical protein